MCRARLSIYSAGEDLPVGYSSIELGESPRVHMSLWLQAKESPHPFRFFFKGRKTGRRCRLSMNKTRIKPLFELRPTFFFQGGGRNYLKLMWHTYILQEQNKI